MNIYDVKLNTTAVTKMFPDSLAKKYNTCQYNTLEDEGSPVFPVWEIILNFLARIIVFLTLKFEEGKTSFEIPWHLLCSKFHEVSKTYCKV
jgi:hypothetical protein